jgi:hypothetical protein
MYNFSKYEPTFNSALDFCANVIECARRNQQAVKALHLTPTYYEWFKSGVQTLMNRALEDGELMQFDGVNIEKGSRFQSKNIVIEYYEQVRV